MQFQVPQFIEVEDRVFGPLTIKQFIYIAGGGGLIFILYYFLGFILGAIPIILVGALTFALAFYKHNNRPFIELVEASFGYYTKSRLYIWKKRDRLQEIAKQAQEKDQENNSKKYEKLYVPTLSQSKLKDLAWSLDIKENINPVTGQDGKTNTR